MVARKADGADASSRPATPSPGAYSARGLHGQVVDRLGRRIVAGDLPEGVAFDLPAMEDELGVSRTALREALKVLSAKGLVDARPRRGTYVLPREGWNVLDADILRWTLSTDTEHALFAQLDEVRAIVEPAAARLAARRRTSGDVEELRRSLRAMEEAGERDDADAAAESDVRFHRALAVASGNTLLGPIQEVVLVGLRRRDRLVHGRRSSSQAVLDLHRSVVDAVERGDSEGAEAAMIRLLGRAADDGAELERATAAAEAVGARGRG
jgi:DNA-binding FadR family transcriptional regulator